MGRVALPPELVKGAVEGKLCKKHNNRWRVRNRCVLCTREIDRAKYHRNKHNRKKQDSDAVKKRKEEAGVWYNPKPNHLLAEFLRRPMPCSHSTCNPESQ